jgi:hypothetical protein
MKAYKYQIWDIQQQCYVKVFDTSIFITLEDAVDALLSLPRTFTPSEPSDYYEIHKIPVCDVCTIEP